MGKSFEVVYILARYIYIYISLIDKKQFIDKERTKSFQEVHWEYSRGNQMGTKKQQEKQLQKNLPAQAKARQTYLHSIQDKKSTKEFVLSTLYKLAQDHKLLKKVAFVL